MPDEQRRIAMVTGAAGVLGSAVVAELLTHGYAVAAADLAAQSGKLEALATDRVMALPVDARGDDWEAALDRVEQTLGPPEGAVLCAGGWAGAPFTGSDAERTWERMLTVNLDSARRALAALLPRLRARGKGSVVVVGSRVFERPWEGAGAAAYVASKSALVALCQVLAAEMMPHGVRLNAVLPSVIDTPQNRAGSPDADHSTWVDPRSLAGVAAFLLSDAARDVSGAALPVYGRA
jgi:NAD(P)-dependent dehydrogenase (short-subunit alcohol dehydrogenase family)